jgi:nitroreductase
MMQVQDVRPHEKPADTEYPLHDLLRRRWSPRAFSERPVERQKLHSLFEAARWAPSSNNEQPWNFVLATKEQPEEYARLLHCLNAKNQVWAQRAPVLMLSVARITFSDDGTPNRHAFHDVGQAVADLTVEATDLGLWVHQMAGFDVERARQTLAIPAGYEPVAMVVIGYYGDPTLLPEPLQQRERAPRRRKSTREFVFRGQWGEQWTA